MGAKSTTRTTVVGCNNRPMSFVVTVELVHNTLYIWIQKGASNCENGVPLVHIYLQFCIHVKAKAEFIHLSHRMKTGENLKVFIEAFSELQT